MVFRRAHTKKSRERRITIILVVGSVIMAPFFHCAIFSPLSNMKTFLLLHANIFSISFLTCWPIVVSLRLSLQHHERFESDCESSLSFFGRARAAFLPSNESPLVQRLALSLSPYEKRPRIGRPKVLYSSWGPSVYTRKALLFLALKSEAVRARP